METEIVKSHNSAGGQIITFYSYKGGVGRSMALANVACMFPKYLANPDQRVLMMDWDLEAPGLHRFFPSQLEQPENKNRPGVIDYFRNLQEILDKDAALYEELRAPKGWLALNNAAPLEEFVCRDVADGGIDCIKAGTLDAQYADLVTTFNWHAFYTKYKAAIETFKELLVQRYAYTLIDSRTGFTDVSGICTMLLPEKLVTVFTPNHQSLDGVLNLASRATDFRLESNDFRPLSIFPLPSRIENAELRLRRDWRQQYQSEFEERFRRIYELQECTLTSYFDEVQLPYVSYYAYGEKVAALEEQSDNLSLRRAYENFFERLVTLDFAWETAAIQTVVSAEPTRVQPSEQYDVFFSYTPDDYEGVQKLALTLREYGVKVFLDAWSLVPGEPWQGALENALNASAAVAVFIGPKGFTANEQPGVEHLLRTDGSKRIVPVLLPGASAASLPPHLETFVYVDFAQGLDDVEAQRKLLSGVTGRKISDLGRPRYETNQYKADPNTDSLKIHANQILRLLIRGLIIPVLGAGINVVDPRQKVSSYPSRRELTEYLNHSFDYPMASAGLNRPDDVTLLAEYISATEGLGPLYSALHEFFTAEYPTNSVHRFFAKLPGALRGKGYPPVNQIIVTTNYDDLLDRAFAAEGEPFHVLRYVADENERGMFAHKSPDGEERMIRNPNMHEVSPKPFNVILKVNGAVGGSNYADDSYVITEDDYFSYLTQDGIRNRLPVDLRAEMTHRRNVYLGYNVDLWFLRATVRLLTSESKFRDASWSIQSTASSMEKIFWRARNIKLIETSLDNYLALLNEQLENLPLSRT